jgi:hypothetical protein
MRQWRHYKNPYIRMVFEDLLLSATAKPYTRDDGTIVNAGDAVLSVADLMENTGLSKPTIIKALKTLKEGGEISNRQVGKISIYHINNYCFYQLSSGKQDLPISGKRDLPQDDASGKRDLPQVVNEIYRSGKRDLPQNKNIKNINKKLVVADAHARTHEEFIAEALGDMMVERGCMAMRITPDEYRQLVTEVTNDWIFRDIPDDEWTLTHLLAQMRIKHNINNRDNERQQTNGGPGGTIDPRTKLAQDAAKAMAALAGGGEQPQAVPF